MPDNRLPEVYRLVAQINEQLWLGHFDVWTQEGLIMFRQGLMLNGALATTYQCEALLKAAFEACERYYQAFQFVVWAGKDSREALASTMLRDRRPSLTIPDRHALPIALSGVAVQVGALVAQPVLGLVESRHGARDQLPEAGPVIHLEQVRHLMGGDIVEHVRRGQDEPPGERQKTVGRARPQRVV